MIMVGSVADAAASKGSVGEQMAGIITISKGHDAAYPWKQIGAGDGSEHRPDQAAHSGIGYYLSPAERGGEPPGIWTGKGVAELGLTPGGIVDRKIFEPLYGRHLDPRDPSGETRLGRAPGKYKTAEEIYAALLAAEPHATAERREELLVEAKAQVRTPDMYWDATFSVSKSISLFHASALANAAAAARSGDQAAAERWEGVAAEIWDSIMEGNAAALDYLQREAGQTRAGYHPGGRWEDAREWVIASFRQHTSRDGDPQLHVHNLILHKVRRESDGQWRALDSMSLYRHRPAASAIAALAMENALTRRLGVRWTPRRDGHGREIADVDQALMDMFSSRRASIGPLTARLALEYEARTGRAPDARALASLRQWANHATRRAKDAAPLDLGALVDRWTAQAIDSENAALGPLAVQVLRSGARARTREPITGAHQARATESLAPLSVAQMQQLAAEAIAAVQQAQPTFTQADLIRQLGERLPAQLGPMTAHDAAALLPVLARQALAEQAIVLSAPEWPRVPDCLRRASGESLYQPHGAARYTTMAQLDLEARLLADAAETGAPRLDPRAAAQLLGADLAQLEARLREAHDPGADAAHGAVDGASAGAERNEPAAPVRAGCPPGASEAVTGCGLRADQAAAALWALTSARRAEILVGPAGSGKTRTVAELARIWRQAGLGDVIGLATSQNAANILAAAGPIRAYNTARFLGHLEGRREALDAMPVQPGSLIILDEASMMSLADMAAILTIARRTGSKVIVTGDHEQLAAVEGGGAMMLLAHRHGYVQLAEPQRFHAEWEREASLRLRAGDVTVLAEYAQRGRLRGGSPEEAAEQAYRGWLADYLAGLDSVLIARTEEHARELSRRARDDLSRYRRIATGPAVPLAAGEQASAGDLICARRNQRAVRAGQDGRALTNRDVLQVLAVAAGPGGRHAEVRRMLDGNGWSAPFLVPHRYLAHNACLAYAVTVHAALGRTTDTAHALLDGSESRQALYTALSRGRSANYAYCITQPSRLADTAEGTRSAPELDRAARLAAERAGLPTGARVEGEASPDDSLPELDEVTVLAQVLARDGSELSATETMERELARADHLGVLGGIWDDLVRQEQAERFEAALRDLLPEHLAEDALGDPAVTWLWRSLREAETFGLDGSQVLREAVTMRSLTGARDVSRVLDSRVRRRLDEARPTLASTWADRVPAEAPAEIRRYLTELAEAMDDRTRRLGEHAAAAQPQWARNALGPLPADPIGRLDWERRAAVIAAYRERYGHDHPADPIGREPLRTSPEARAAWHGALAALGRIEGIDLRARSDSELWLRRGTYERETAWAPRHVGRELQFVRTAARDAAVSAMRAKQEARVARSRRAADRHRELVRRLRAVEAKAVAEEQILADVQDTRRQWERLTESTRRVAVAADMELRRRHPRMPIAPLLPHPSERFGAVGRSSPEPAAAPQLPSRALPSTATRESDAVLAALGLTLETADEPVPASLIRLQRETSTKRAELEELADLRLPADEREGMSAGLAWPDQSRRQRDTVLQPPRTEVEPSAQMLRANRETRSTAAEPEMEAGA
jgi:conjugative relaxase-like TrwC/TraI family protein